MTTWISCQEAAFSLIGLKVQLCFLPLLIEYLVVYESPIDNIRQMLYKGPKASSKLGSNKAVYNKLACGNCKKKMDSAFCRANPHKCRFTRRCIICTLPLSNLMRYCKLCQHAGHVDHLDEWFETETECPVPECNCQCILDWYLQAPLKFN